MSRPWMWRGFRFVLHEAKDDGETHSFWNAKNVQPGVEIRLIQHRATLRTTAQISVRRGHENALIFYMEAAGTSRGTAITELFYQVRRLARRLQ